MFFFLFFPFLSQLGLFPSSHGGEPTLSPPHSWSVTGSEAHGWTGRAAAAHLLPQIYSTGKKPFFEACALQEITLSDHFACKQSSNQNSNFLITLITTVCSDCVR